MEWHPSTLADALDSIHRADPHRRAALAFIYKALVRMKPRLRTSPENADDAVQTLADRLWRRGLVPERRSEAQANALLLQMLANTAVDDWRKLARHVPTGDVEMFGSTHTNPEQIAAARQTLARLAGAAERLAAGDPWTRPKDRPHVVRRIERGLRARGLCSGREALPPGRSSGAAKAEQRAVGQRLSGRRGRGDVIEEALRDLLESVKDLRGAHGD